LRENEDDVSDDILSEFNSKIEMLKYKLNREGFWLHWEFSHNINEVSDFVEYIQFNKNAEKEFLDKVMNLIKIFELR